MSKTFSGRISRQACRLVVVMTLIWTAAFSSAAQAKDEIVLGLAIPVTLANGAMFSMADALGYFDEENIEVTTEVLEGAGSVVPQVARGNLTVGQPLPETLFTQYDPVDGALPVTYFYNAIPANTLELAVLESSDIHSVEDLRGKQIGVGSLSWGTIPQTRALLKDAGLTPGDDVDIVAVGVLGSGFHALREGRVAALNYNHTWVDLLEQSGTSVRRLSYPELYDRMVNNPFLAHQATFDDQGDLLGRFGRAYTKGLVACDANPDACVEIFWERHPESRPDGEREEVMAESIEILQRRLDLLMRDENGETRRFGEFDIELIENYVRELHETGQVETADVPVSQYFTNDLVSQFNDFDMEQVIKEARDL